MQLSCFSLLLHRSVLPLPHCRRSQLIFKVSCRQGCYCLCTLSTMMVLSRSFHVCLSHLCWLTLREVMPTVYDCVYLHLQTIHALEQKNDCSADDVEAVLLWQEPLKSSKTFLGGMYILICLRQLVLGAVLFVEFLLTTQFDPYPAPEPGAHCSRVFGDTVV